jgi:hypothetical protein
MLCDAGRITLNHTPTAGGVLQDTGRDGCML